MYADAVRLNEAGLRMAPFGKHSAGALVYTESNPLELQLREDSLCPVEVQEAFTTPGSLRKLNRMTLRVMRDRLEPPPPTIWDRLG